MRSFILFLALLFCSATTSFAALRGTTVPQIPASIANYTKEDLNAVKNDKPALNTFVALTPSFIINAVNDRQVAAASYAVFLRSAFQKTANSVTDYLYYVRAKDRTSKNGKNYYGTFRATKSAAGKVKFVDYTIDAAVNI